MKRSVLPSTIGGWVIFYLFLIALSAMAYSLFTGKDIPQGTAGIVGSVVAGYLGLITGQAMSSNKPAEKPEGSGKENE